MDLDSSREFAGTGLVDPNTLETFLNLKDPVAGVSAARKPLVAFEGTLTGSKEINSGIWLNAGTSTNLVARKGLSAPGTDGSLFREFKSLSVIDRRGALFTATLSPGNDLGCWATDSEGKLQLLIRNGDAIGDKTIRSFEILTTVRGSEGQRRAWAGTFTDTSVILHTVFTDGTDGITTVSIP